MKDFINRLYRNHSLIFKVLLLICTTFLIVYLFPKSGKFKYDFEKGKPWQSENLYAPFDFAIQKAENEVFKEQESIKNNALLYFTLDTKVKDSVTELYKTKFEIVFPDSVYRNSRELYPVGEKLLDNINTHGVLD
mgnify:CR=1 FL=1